MNYYHTYNSPIGTLLIEATDNHITRLSFQQEERGREEQLTPLIRTAFEQLDEYFAGRRKTFDLPLLPEGTPFQEKVWKTLQTIPYGELWTYKDVALRIRQPRASRAVGMANNKNPIMIFIPCHRVIGTDGKLVGYAAGIDIKHKLLIMEKAHTPIGLWEEK